MHVHSTADYYAAHTNDDAYLRAVSPRTAGKSGHKAAEAPHWKARPTAPTPAHPRAWQQCGAPGAKPVWAPPLFSPSDCSPNRPPCGVIPMTGGVLGSSPLGQAGTQCPDQIPGGTPGSGISPVGRCGISFKPPLEAEPPEWC